MSYPTRNATASSALYAQQSNQTKGKPSSIKKKEKSCKRLLRAVFKTNSPHSLPHFPSFNRCQERPRQQYMPSVMLTHYHKNEKKNQTQKRPNRSAAHAKSISALDAACYRCAAAIQRVAGCGAAAAQAQGVHLHTAALLLRLHVEIEEEQRFGQVSDFETPDY